MSSQLTFSTGLLQVDIELLLVELLLKLLLELLLLKLLLELLLLELLEDDLELLELLLDVPVQLGSLGLYPIKDNHCICVTSVFPI